MDSDFFGPSQRDDVVPGTSTQYSYSHLILFDWTSGLRNPFKIYMTHEFTEHEIRDKWILYQLSAKFRKKILKPLAVCPNSKMSLFAKIETSKVFLKHFFITL